MRLALALTLSLATVAASAQQLYRWTDETGRTHVTDTPPPANARNVQKRDTGPAKSDAGASAGAEPFVLQEARKNYPVSLYSTPGCEACDQARKVLNARGVPFKEISVNDEASLAELKKAVGSNSVPSIIVGSTVFKGFEEGAVQRLLDVAGYPKTGILPVRNQGEPTPAGEPKPDVAPVAPETAKGPYAPKPPKAPAPERKKAGS